MESIFSQLNELGLTREEVLNGFWSYVPNLIAAFAVIIGGIIFYLITARVLRSALAKTAVQESLARIVVRSLYRNIIGILIFIMALNQLGVDVTAAIAGVGIAGIAIGFAAKETLSNVMSGFSIFIDHLYAKGDWVEIAGKYGQVKQITLRTTKIRTLDNIFVVVPNAQVTGSPVTNFSEEGMVRISADVGIAYKESIDQAREVLLKAAAAIEGVRSDPAPRVVVDALADSSVNLKVRLWVDDAGTDPSFRFQLTEACKKALDGAGIEIPFPQRDIHTRNAS